MVNFWLKNNYMIFTRAPKTEGLIKVENKMTEKYIPGKCQPKESEGS